MTALIPMQESLRFRSLLSKTKAARLSALTLSTGLTITTYQEGALMALEPDNTESDSAQQFNEARPIGAIIAPIVERVKREARDDVSG